MLLSLSKYAHEMTPEISESMKIISGFLQDRIVKEKEMEIAIYQKTYSLLYNLCIMIPMGRSDDGIHFIEVWIKEMYKSILSSIRLLKSFELVKKDYDFISGAFAYPFRVLRFQRVEFADLVNLRSVRLRQFDRIKPFLMDFDLLGDSTVILTRFFIRLALPR